nr:hypothetical protein [Mesorhizobium sp.]
MSHEPYQILTHLRGGATSASDAGWPDYQSANRSTVTLRNVEIHYVLMEMPMQDALAILPPALHPSVPAHFTMMFHRVPESPVGAFQFAVVGVGCRAGIRPRMLTTAAFATSQASADFLSDHGQFPVRVADVMIRNSYYGIDSSVSTDGRKIVDVTTFALEPVLGGGAAVKFCAPLNPVTYVGNRSLLQVDIGFEYHETARGRLEVRSLDPAVIGPAASMPEFGICGVRSVVDMEFHSDRSIYDANVQSEEGGLTILPDLEAA